MKVMLFGILVWGSLQAQAATIVQFKAHVETLPASFLGVLSSEDYDLKPFWKEDRMTIQRLPASNWETVLRQRNLAIRIKNPSHSLGFIDDPNIERILTDRELDSFRLEKVTPVKEPVLPCNNSIYLGEYSAKISQNLTKAKDCDGYWLFPEEDTPYEFSVSHGKTLEIYEEGKVIQSGSKITESSFQVGARGQLVVVRGNPGPYTVSWKPKKYKDYKRNASFGELSNIFGFGSIEASKAYSTLTKKGSEKTSRVFHQGAYMMNVGSLWSQRLKGALTRVAVIDTGVDFAHPFLAEVLEEGINFSEPGAMPQDDEGHGTHVSGIIHQVAPLAKIVPIKVLDKDGSGTLEHIVKGVEWAIAQNVDVINLSIGGEVDHPAFLEALEKAADRGILVAMAAGNDSRFTPTFPANYVSRVKDLGFAVGALNLSRELTVFSDRSGNDPDMKYVAAFGERVNSSIPGGGYKKFSGTSMATPQVSGLFALFKSLPETRPSGDILKALRSSVLLTSVED